MSRFWLACLTGRYGERSQQPSWHQYIVQCTWDQSPHQWRGREACVWEGQGLQSCTCCKYSGKPCVFYLWSLCWNRYLVRFSDWVRRSIFTELRWCRVLHFTHWNVSVRVDGLLLLSVWTQVRGRQHGHRRHMHWSRILGLEPHCDIMRTWAHHVTLVL